MNFWKSLIASSTFFILLGCATITKEDYQPVVFSSDPPGATVFIDNFPQGKTPGTFLVKRKRGDTSVVFELPGYQSKTFVLDKSLNPIGISNLLLGMGAPIGAGVDYMTGKANDYQDRVHVNLRPSHVKDSHQRNIPQAGNNDNSSLKRELMLRFNRGEISKDKYEKLTKALGE